MHPILPKVGFKPQGPYVSNPKGVCLKHKAPMFETFTRAVAKAF